MTTTNLSFYTILKHSHACSHTYLALIAGHKKINNNFFFRLHGVCIVYIHIVQSTYNNNNNNNVTIKCKCIAQHRACARDIKSNQ